MKTIGTLAWLFHVQSTGVLSRPLDQLLHYPVPKRPIEAFHNHVCSSLSFVFRSFFPLYVSVSFFTRVSPIMHSSSIDTHFCLFRHRLIIRFHFLTVLDISSEPGAYSIKKYFVRDMTSTGVYLLFSSFVSRPDFCSFSCASL